MRNVNPGKASLIPGITLAISDMCFTSETQSMGKLIRRERLSGILKSHTSDEKCKVVKSKYISGNYTHYPGQILHSLMISKEFSRLIKFGLVGGLGVGINMGVFYLLTDKLGLYYLLSSVISWETTIISMFAMHELWTFRDLRTDGKNNLLKRFLKFNSIRLTNPVIILAILFCLTELAGMNHLISNLIAILTVTIWNYMASIYIVWRK
jgi:dolichol-phosphate mannosyltransferase